MLPVLVSRAVQHFKVRKFLTMIVRRGSSENVEGRVCNVAERWSLLEDTKQESMNDTSTYLWKSGILGSTRAWTYLIGSSQGKAVKPLNDNIAH